jgi:hypothetical protein
MVVLCSLFMVFGLILTPCLQASESSEQIGVVFAGNTATERMRIHGYFETFLHCHFTDQHVRVRNMGWSADEVGLSPRPTGFPALLEELSSHPPAFLFLFYGMNESFGEAEGLETFKVELGSLLDTLKENLSQPDRETEIILVSPIAQEACAGVEVDLPKRHHWLKTYSRAMEDIADKSRLRFVNIFEPSLKGMQTANTPPWTINGIHLNDYGNWQTSKLLVEAMEWLETEKAPEKVHPRRLKALRRAVYEKNQSFLHAWRPPNMEYLYGTRNQLPGAEGMPAEQDQWTDIMEQHDRRIWRMEKPAPLSIWSVYHPPSNTWKTTPDYHGIRHPELGKVTPMGGDLHEGQGDMLTPVEAMEQFRLPPGYTINAFATEQSHRIANPVAMEFDSEGRLWVANSPTWPHPIPGTPPDDSVIILEDTDGDGTADQQTVFLDQLNMIHGIALGHGGVYISQTPNLIHARDTTGDGHADTVQTILHGFGGEDVEHSINNFQWGPDGALYFMEGIFFHSQIETPYGPERVKDGGVFRYEPRTHRMNVHVSYAFWNPWGLSFTKWGDGIILDASSHDYFGLDLLSSRFHYPKEKRNKHRTLSFAPDGLGPAAGIQLLESTHFPEAAQGRFVANQLSGGFRGIVWYDMTEEGSAYAVKRVAPDLLVSEDPFFRPLALKIGPDGALYVADFYSALIENTSQPKRRLGRDHRHGRIWRIRSGERPLSIPPAFKKMDTDGLLSLLNSPESRNRHWARRRLQEKTPAEVTPSLDRWTASLKQATSANERLLLETLWVYQGLGVLEVDLLNHLLESSEWRARAGAVRVLRFWNHAVPGALELLRLRVEDEHPRVRLQALLACSEFKSLEARNVALKVTRHSMDQGIQHVLEETMNYFDTLLDEK